MKTMDDLAGALVRSAARRGGMSTVRIGPPPARQTIDRVAAMVGVRVDWTRDCAGHGWNGRDVAGARDSLSAVVHDIAHWMVCAPLRRHIPDFGLGCGSAIQHRSCTATRVVSTEAADREEERAVLLGILIERQVRARSWRCTWDALYAGGIVGDIECYLASVLGDLHRLGLIDEAGRVVALTGGED